MQYGRIYDFCQNRNSVLSINLKEKKRLGPEFLLGDLGAGESVILGHKLADLGAFLF
jgi:hypothetical protein